MDNRLYWIWLTQSGLNPIRQRELLTLFGAPKEIYECTSNEYTLKNIDKRDFSHIKNKSLNKATSIWEECLNNNIHLLTYHDENYPELLKQIPDPPMVLYFRGNLGNDSFPLAMVGTRYPTVYANKMAQKFSLELANAGMTIVSGMARGIDTICHSGALKAGKRTIAVLGCGVDVTYPAENEELKKVIEGNGAVISEFPPGTPPHAGNFPIRNRIISGLSIGTFVIEGSIKSGTMLTVRHALEQDRDVFTIPTNLDNLKGGGNLIMLQQGAKLVMTASDILEEYALNYTEQLVTALAPEMGEKDPILAALHNSIPMNIDQICKATSLSASVANSMITMLELSGKVVRLPGKCYILR